MIELALIFLFRKRKTLFVSLTIHFSGAGRWKSNYTVLEFYRKVQLVVILKCERMM